MGCPKLLRIYPLILADSREFYRSPTLLQATEAAKMGELTLNFEWLVIVADILFFGVDFSF